jgi:hypothetical protein
MTTTAHSAPDFTKGLPAAIESERFILGAVLRNQHLDPKDDHSPLCFEKIRTELSAAEFSTTLHGIAWSVLDDLWARQFQTFDFATLAAELDRRGHREQPPSYWMDLTEHLPDLFSLDFHVAKVKEKASYRRIISHHHTAASLAVEEIEPPEQLLAADLEFCRVEQSRVNGAEASPTLPRWPEPLREEAYHGVAGELVRLIEPHSEADPAALLMQFLVSWGSLAGRGPYMQAEADRHHPNEYVVLVGVSSVGRKGSAWGRIASILESVDEEWLESRLLYGIGSGERLIDMAAETDHRVLIHEGEFARLLGIINREGSTISSNIRLAWDKGILEINSRQKTAKAKGAHISMIGHITKDELSKKLSDIEVTNGFGNRILWVCARRCKSLPHGSDITGDAGPILRQLIEATRHARKLGNTRLLWDSEAYDLWSEVYESLAAGQPGLLGSATSRAAPHVLRISLIYALLDCAAQVRAEHLRAALEVWRYCYDSARFIWGAALGDPTADQALKLIRGAGANGTTRWDLSRAFSGHKSADELDRAVAVLTERGLIRSVETQTEGRRETRHFAS